MRRQLLVNGALLLLALGTLGVVWITREDTTTAELESRKNKLLPSFRKEALTRLVLTQDGRELELQLDAERPGEFRIIKPWPERADIATVNQLLGSLDLASALRSADGIAAEQAGFTGHPLRLRLEMGKKVQVVTLGAVAPAPAGARYAEVTSDGSTRRYVVSAGVASELSPPFDKFREPRLLDYGRSELQKVEIARGERKLTLSQAERGTFFIEQAAGRELVSRDVTERVFNALSRLSTEHFVEVDAARKALTDSALHVTLTPTDKGVTPIQLTFGICPSSPGDALVLKEQAGKAARAGCVSAEVDLALSVTADDARLQGPFAARPDEVEELRITHGRQKLELARKDKAFVLRSAGNAEVPLDAGNARISAIVEGRGERATTSDLAELGLDKPAGELTIQTTSADEASHRTEVVAIGRPRRDGSVCLKRQADAVVLCFGAETARAFEPDASLLKGLGLLGFAPSDLSTFSVEAPGLREVVRRQDDGSYTLEEPRGFNHDGSLVADAVQTLGTLRAVRWERSDDAPSFGLAAPRLRVGITLASGGPVRELSVGAAASDGFFARLTPDPGIFVLPRAVVTELSTPLIDRSLCPLAEGELTRLDLKAGKRTISLTRQGEVWQGTALTAARARELVETVTALRADFAVHLGAARPAEGFAEPVATVSATGVNGKHYRLSLGARDTLNDAPVVYARLDGVDATFALSSRAAQDLRSF